MKAFHHPDSALHRPLYRIAGGELRPTFETPARIDLLREGLAEAGVQPVRAAVPEARWRAAVASLHDAGYVTFLEEGFAIWQAMPGTGPELRTSVHTSRHMTRLPQDFLGRAGYYQADSSAVLVAGTWAAASASAAVALAAADEVLTSAGRRLAYALCRPPGHHACTDQAGGFCYLNNAALAAQAAVDAGARVAILDLDVHHGNGTQQIFYRRDDVLTVSLHGDPAWLYPFHAGYADETGAGEGSGANLNLPLPLHSGLDRYRDALHTAVRRIRDHGAEVLVIALGLDAYRGDPFACMGLEREDFVRLGAACRLGLPTVVVQEGGYPSPDLGGLLAAFLRGIGG